MQYSDIAQPWQQSPQNAPRLPMRANSSFFLKHHPKNWELVEFEIPKQGKKPATKKYLWIPKLHNHWESAGVEGTRGTDAAPDSSLARAKYDRNGWTILLPKDHDYLRIYPALGGSYHIDKWTQLENLAGEIVTTYDRQGNNDFRRKLVAEGVIALPHRQILRKIIHKHSQMIANKTKFQHIPENKKKLDDLYDLNREMVKAMDAVKETGIKNYEL